MTVRSAVAVVGALVMVISAVELSTWALGRAMSIVVPAPSVGDADTPVPQVSEIDAPSPTTDPALTW
jgi:hypothetical protein